jgi:hypothetical protein
MFCFLVGLVAMMWHTIIGRLLVVELVVAYHFL